MPGAGFPKRAGSLCCRPAGDVTPALCNASVLREGTMRTGLCSILKHSLVLRAPYEELSGSLLCSRLSCGSQEMGFCTGQMLKESFEGIGS